MPGKLAATVAQQPALIGAIGVESRRQGAQGPAGGKIHPGTAADRQQKVRGEARLLSPAEPPRSGPTQIGMFSTRVIGMNRLVVLGSVNAITCCVSPLSPPLVKPLTGHSYQVVPGGKGANQAVAAARLGAEVSFIARIGDDAIGRQMREGFAQDGIDVSAVELDPKLPTGIAIIYVSDEGENSIGISAEASGATPAVVKRPRKG